MGAIAKPEHHIEYQYSVVKVQGRHQLPTSYYYSTGLYADATLIRLIVLK